MPPAPPPTPSPPGPARAARRAGRVVAAAGLAAVAVATLGPQPTSPHGDRSFGHWCLVCGEVGGADVVQNVLLFLPIGAGLALAGWSRRRATLLGLLVSTAVELAQAAGVSGRFATLSDVVTNTLGTALGAAIAATWPIWLAPTPAVARRLAAATAACWLGLLGLATWAFDRDPAPGPTPPVPSPIEATPDMGWFAGAVTDARFGPLALRHRGSGAVIVHAATGGEVRGDVIASGSDPRPFIVPMLYVHGSDPRRSELVLGQIDRSAVLTVRLRAARLRLRQPTLRIPETFARGETPTTGTARRIEGAFAGRVFRLAVTSAAGTVSRALPLPAVTGWALVAPFVRADGSGATLLTALWVAGFLAPLGYWLGCGVGATRAGRAGAAATAAAIVAAGLGALPAATGAPETPGWAWGAAAAAAGAGLAAAALLRRRRTPPSRSRR